MTFLNTIQYNTHQPLADADFFFFCTTSVVRNPDLVSRYHKISPGSATVVVAKPGLDILAPKSVTKIGPCNELLSRGSATVVVRNPDLASRHPQISPGSATVVVRNPDLKNSLLEPGLIKSG